MTLVTSRPSTYARPTPRVGRRRRHWRARPRLWILVLSVGLALAAAGRAAGAPHRRVPLPEVTVRAGDTLWGLALHHAPAGTDPRDWIFRVQQLNGMHGALLAPGVELRLPAGSH